MKITREQQDMLETLSCERLSSNEGNFRVIESFFNPRNEKLAQTLLNEAFEEDENDRIAYYLVKDKYGHILFYFSLKCGQLYDKHLDFQLFKELAKLYDDLLKIKKEDDTNSSDIEIIDCILESIRSRKGVIKADLKKLSKTSSTLEQFEKIVASNYEKVGATFAGVEIVQFCANEDCRQYWKQLNMPQKLGVVVFWHFIVPIVFSIMKLVGCQYIFLFAADDSEDEDLVKYYKGWLKFEDSESRSAATPVYDFTCKFLYQNTNTLESKRSAFYDNFNPDADAV